MSRAELEVLASEVGLPGFAVRWKTETLKAKISARL